ncbi:MAG: hypothetical protein M9963_06370 [Kiritimatiellae bacterium]|nr:hypothetical protein [Kiritimatiellia bacterium]
MSQWIMQSFSHAYANAGSLRNAKRFRLQELIPADQQIAQRAAVHIFHHNVRKPIRHSGIEHLHDTRMIQASRCARFLLKALARLGVRQIFG